MARNPHRQGGLATPPPQLDDEDEPAAPPAPVDDEDQDDEDEDDAGDDPAGDDPRPARTAGRGVQVASDGAGWVLGLLLYGWVLLPFIKGGPAQVKAVWMAKFLNKAPDGSWLP